MSAKPEALRLADALEIADANISLIDDTLWVKINPGTLDEAAAELRRLHEVNQELLEALKKMVECSHTGNVCLCADASQKAYAAIAKATGEQA